MDDRKNEILNAVISLYSSIGQPVASALLMHYPAFDVSSATLRAEMATLTRLGLLEQPHTSAGRVPSLKGYRYYVEHVMSVPQLEAQERARYDTFFDKLDVEPNRLAQRAASELSELTGFCAVAAMPRSDAAHIVHFNVLQVGKLTAALIGVSGRGEVETRIVRLGMPVTKTIIERAEQVLNENLAFVTAEDFTKQRSREVCDIFGAEVELYKPFVRAARELVHNARDGSVFVEGFDKLFAYREFDAELRTLTEFLFNSDALYNFINTGESDIKVLFGQDIEGYFLPGMTAVTKRFYSGGGTYGYLAVVGPARMNYLAVIPRLKFFADKLGNIITGGGAIEHERQKEG